MDKELHFIDWAHPHDAPDGSSAADENTGSQTGTQQTGAFTPSRMDSKKIKPPKLKARPGILFEKKEPDSV